MIYYDTKKLTWNNTNLCLPNILLDIVMVLVHTIEKEGVILWKLIIQYNEADTCKIT
jgi:hypothetical protein